MTLAKLNDRHREERKAWYAERMKALEKLERLDFELVQFDDLTWCVESDNFKRIVSPRRLSGEAVFNISKHSGEMSMLDPRPFGSIAYYEHLPEAVFDEATFRLVARFFEFAEATADLHPMQAAIWADNHDFFEVTRGVYKLRGPSIGDNAYTFTSELTIHV